MSWKHEKSILKSRILSKTAEIFSTAKNDYIGLPRQLKNDIAFSMLLYLVQIFGYTQNELFNNLKAYINLGWRRELEGLSLSFFVVVVVALAEVSSVELGSTVARER